MKSTIVFLAGTALVMAATAKLPAPSDEAKAKAAETAAKTAHVGKVDAYLLCKSQDKVAAQYHKTAAGKEKKATVAATAACADPGPFVYVPASASSAPAASATPAAPAAQTAAAPAAKDKKKP